MSTENLIRRMIDRHRVLRVEIATHDGKVYTATAYPLHSHPIVNQRRQAAIRAKDKWTIAEMQELDEKCWSEPIAKSSAGSIDIAVFWLASSLKRAKDPA